MHLLWHTSSFPTSTTPMMVRIYPKVFPDRRLQITKSTVLGYIGNDTWPTKYATITHFLHDNKRTVKHASHVFHTQKQCTQPHTIAKATMSCFGKYCKVIHIKGQTKFVTRSDINQGLIWLRNQAQRVDIMSETLTIVWDGDGIVEEYRSDTAINQYHPEGKEEEKKYSFTTLLSMLKHDNMFTKLAKEKRLWLVYGMATTSPWEPNEPEGLTTIYGNGINQQCVRCIVYDGGLNCDNNHVEKNLGKHIENVSKVVERCVYMKDHKFLNMPEIANAIEPCLTLATLIEDLFDPMDTDDEERDPWMSFEDTRVSNDLVASYHSPMRTKVGLTLPLSTALEAQPCRQPGVLCA